MSITQFELVDVVDETLEVAVVGMVLGDLVQLEFLAKVSCYYRHITLCHLI